MSFLERLEAEPASFLPALPLALGLAAGFYPLFLPRPLVLLASCAAAGPAAVLLELGRRSSRRGLRLRALLCLSLAAGLALGLALRTDEAGRSRPAFPPVPTAPDAGAAVGLPLSRLELSGLKGRLSADSSPASSGYRSYPLRVEVLRLEGPGIRAETSASFSIPVLAAGGEALEAGAPLEVRGRLALPKAGSGRGPAFFAQRGAMAADGRLPAGEGARADRGPRDLRELRGGLRRAFRAAIRRAGGGEASGLLEALLLGFREDLDAEEAEDFRKAGCAHVLALSGQHLSILAAAVGFLLKPLFGPRKARLASLLLAAAFVFVAGPGPSLLRSILMYGVAALAFFVDRPQPSLAVLSLVFVAAALLDPAAARSLSFALSYLALFGILALGPSFKRLLLPLLPPPVAAALAASLAAQAATAPLVAAAFGALYPAGILASAISGPLVALFIWWGLGASLLAGLATALVPALGTVLGPSLEAGFCAALATVSGLLHRVLAGTMSFFASFPALEAKGASAALAGAVVVLAAAFVYALPYVEYRAFAARRSRRAAPGRGA